MKNQFFTTLVALVAICLAQVGYAQHQIQFPPNDYDHWTEHINEVRRTAGAPFDMYGYEVSSIRNMPWQGYGATWFHDTGHYVYDWHEVGKVYERIYDGVGNLGTKPYMGPINWTVRKTDGNTVWASGIETHSSPGIPTNSLRVTRGAVTGPPPQTMPAGAIYAVTAELDGEIYGGYNHGSSNLGQSQLTWGMVEAWTYPSGSSNLCSPAGCRKWTYVNTTLTNIQFSGYTGLSGVKFGNVHEIYVHPRSTVLVENALVGSKENLRVRYIRAAGVQKISPEKRTDENGRAYFHVNWKQFEPGFQVLYDGCWQPVPRQTTGPNACNLCFILNPKGRVALALKQYDVPLQSPYNVFVFNSTGTTCYNDYDSNSYLPLTSNNGTVSFTPPSGQQFLLYIQTAHGNFDAGPINASTTTATVPLNYTIYPAIPTLTSPADGQYYVTGSTVPLRWNTTTGANAYYLWLKQGTGNWVGYNMGNTTGADLGNVGNGTWQWDVQAVNVSGQTVLTVGESATRVFHVNATGRPFSAPIDPWQIDGLSDEEEEWQEEILSNSNGLTDTTGTRLGQLIVQDENENVLSPMQGLEKATTKNVVQLKAVLGNGIQVNQVDEEVLENIRALLNPNLNQEQDDDWLDWLFMTPEGLYFHLLFGNPY